MSPFLIQPLRMALPLANQYARLMNTYVLQDEEMINTTVNVSTQN